MEKTLRFAMFVIGFVLIAMAVSNITHAKFSKLKDSTLETSGVVYTAKDRERQLDCLAKNIYYEAGTESFEGKVAVAQVTINRSESGKFPKDICGVVYQKTSFTGKIVCQFSWYCENTGRPLILYKENYKESYEVAKKVLLEDFRLSGLKEAMYYHADYVNPNWGKSKITKIGHHIFYKE
jgi:spore germination cell wall hydrolase CwlJ-like protein